MLQTLRRLRFFSKYTAAGLASALLLLSHHSAFAKLTLPAIFGSHMVLQQDGDIPVWGWADPGESVTVSFANESVKGTADQTGKWIVQLPEMNMQRTGQTLTVTSSTGDVLNFDDVLVGEVWICSGQSNMEWPVISSNNAEQEMAAANYPEIRYFAVKKEIAHQPQSDLIGQWVICSPETVERFSAVGYYFGRHVHNTLNRPIGLIGTNWGGTVAEAWTSAEALNANLPEFSETIATLPEMEEKLASNKETYLGALNSYNASYPKLYALEADLEAAAAWAAPELDDSGWESMSVPQNWENAGYEDLDGIVWLRKTVNIPQAWAGRDLVLRPGSIDEIDVTWFNGHKVGSQGNIKQNIVEYWNQARDYRVPGELVKAGPTVIAIRVIDSKGQGGLWGDSPEALYLAPVNANESERIALAGKWNLKAEYILPQRPRNPSSTNVPTVLYNKMIAPLIPYGIRGVIWYQGESNAGRPEQYRTLLPTMIADWRHRWGRGDLTFLIVQLANYRQRSEQPIESKWAELREAQMMTAVQNPNTGMVVTIDIGEAGDIHPKNKQDVGTRLGLAAEGIAYKQNVTHEGPTLSKMTIEGKQVILHFDDTAGDLVSHSPVIGGFSIRGEDGNFVWADAAIQGNTVLVSAESIEQPVAVRYAWADNPEAPLYNQAGLPMVPFRTDAPTAE